MGHIEGNGLIKRIAQGKVQLKLNQWPNEYTNIQNIVGYVVKKKKHYNFFKNNIFVYLNRGTQL